MSAAIPIPTPPPTRTCGLRCSGSSTSRRGTSTSAAAGPDDPPRPTVACYHRHRRTVVGRRTRRPPPMRIVAGGGGGVSYAAHMSPAEPPDWLNRFPPLRAISDPAWRRIAERLSVMRIEPGTSVFRVGDPCRNYLPVSEGAVRVQTVSESGREIVLYRVGSGETCALTTSCLYAGELYPAEGITETAVQAVAMPKGLFDEAVAA